MTATTAAGPAPTAGPARGPWIASAVLAVAILVVAGLAVATLVTAPVSPAGRAEQAAPAPAAPAPAAPAPSAGPGSPAAGPVSAPAVTDPTGRALPAAVATGVQGLYTALGTGDLAGVQSRYQPATAFAAAPWSQVAPLLAQPASREALLAALRVPPERRSGIYLYSAGGARVGVDAQGRMAFMLVP